MINILYFNKNFKIFFLKLWVSQKGYSLIELMVALSIGSMMALGLSKSLEYTSKSLNTNTINQDQTEFQRKINNALSNPTYCTQLIASSLDPSSTSNQPISLQAGNNLYNGNSSPSISKDLRINSLYFLKTNDSFLNGGSNFYTSQNTNYWPLSGNIVVNIDNLSVSSNRSYGKRSISYTFSINLTLQRPASGGSWTIRSCSTEIPENIINSGWNTADTLDPNYCTTLTTTSGDNIICPSGMYLISQVQSTQYISRISYTPQCDCVGSCKGCACVAGSACSSMCDSSGNPNVTANSCMGTCNASASCNGFPVIDSVHKLTVKCCYAKK